MTLAVAAVAPAVPLSNDMALVVTRLTTVAFVVLLGWFVRTALHIWTTIHL